VKKCVNKFLISHHKTRINTLHTRYIESFATGSRMDNFTDIPKVVICSSDIDGDTLEAVWIVASLATTAAITVTVGWVRSWRRRSRPRPRESASVSAS